MEPQAALKLPADGVLLVGPGGIEGNPCNNNVEIWIGTQLYAECKGAPGTIYTFGEIMEGGGTLNAIVDTDLTEPICDGVSISLSCTYSGAVGTITSGGTSDFGVNYTFQIDYNGSSYQTASGTITYPPTPEVFSIENAPVGSYEVVFTISTFKETEEYTNTEAFTFTVN